MRAASILKLPVLRKDFIVDEYQVVESKAIGALAILLIASALSKREVLILLYFSAWEGYSAEAPGHG